MFRLNISIRDASNLSLNTEMNNNDPKNKQVIAANNNSEAKSGVMLIAYITS